ncbi:helix-turn-helix protein [Flavobacterium araucananum]|uniref:DNA-binding protein n=1 Tax=Flavobacterium araucananum TaxID=946678 RepID=A0A227P7A1_9FLAO|nr:AraC family transcriptional regulator [Flavobacterium araucananum]OXG05056.1 DNA-binding protein [Flavobacterium araucananum]PWJ96770.1 helix-turn-helix protein [Flavobacterium araucananum]
MEGYNSYRMAVPSGFQEVFSHFYFAKNATREAIDKSFLPHYQTIMIFSFGTPPLIFRGDYKIIVESCIVLGPIKSSFEYTLPAGADIFVCNFIDDAFYRFFGNADIASTRAMHPDTVLNQNCFTILWEVLSKISCSEGRVATLLDFCQDYLGNRNGIAEQLANCESKVLSPIKEISMRNNLSERAVQVNHKKHFGYTAKEIYRHERFLQAIKMIQRASLESSRIDWFEIIAQCGYYDQSQLIRDFNHYLNLSPLKYIKFQQLICNANP